MLRSRFGIAIALLCVCATGSYAQDTGVPVHKSHKAHTKKVPKADDSSVEDWDIAAPGASSKADVGSGNESEGRKKFFQQSTTMDNGGPGGGSGGADSKPSTGFTPSMGLSF
jgi:hypothetical protein